MRSARWGMVVAGIVIFVTTVFTIARPVQALPPQVNSASAAAQSSDFEFFKDRVEPVFLKKRPGHTRCYVCHSGVPGSQGTSASRALFRLDRLLPGQTFWTEEQSRDNYERIKGLLVIPGEPSISRLLMHPLDPAAGGDRFHEGGHQFESQDDPDWQTIAEWVKNMRPTSGKQ